MLSAVSASAAVTVDNASSDKGSSLVGLSSLTWSHTVGGGTEKALYVGVSSATTLLPASIAPSLLSVSGVTYNGIAMTRVGSTQSPGLLNLGLISKSYVDIYRLVNPPSGAHNVVVSFSTLGIVPLDVFVNQAVGGAISYNGVDQVTPNGFFVPASGNSNSPSVTVTGGTTDDLVMNVLASSPNAEDFTAIGQTLHWQGNFNPLVGANFDLGAGGTKAGAASVTANWTLENSNTWALGGLAIRAASNPASVFTVNTNLDNESNGCAVGSCTLREAINDARDTPEPDTIVFAPSVTGTIVLTNGQLVADSNITINGPGARNLTVSGNNTDRVFLIATPLFGGDITVNISGLTIANGFAQPVLIGSTLIGDGGGILNGVLLGLFSGTSTLNLTEVSVSNNRATTLGGGIATRLNARTNISRSLISNNTSNAVVPVLGGDVGGGGISNIGGTTTASNSTITNNNSLAAGGGILNAAGVVNLTNNTISHNRSTLAGGGVVSTVGVIIPTLGVTNLRNTIIAQNNDLLATNILGRDVVGVLGSFRSLGNNLIGSNFGAEIVFEASVFGGATPQPNVDLDLVGGIAVGNRIIDPLLGTLRNNGGATNTRLPFAGSPALDNGNNCVLNNNCTPNPQNNNPSFAFTLEQRGAGFPRLLNTTIDIGATEGFGTITPIIVNSLLDNENDGCGIGICTLREAVNDANSTTVPDTINFQTGLTGTIFLTAGQLIAYTDMTINGPGARNLTVSGNNANRVFLIATPILGGDINVNINGLTVKDGFAQPALIGTTLIGDGGGILNGALLGVLSGTSTLTLTEVTVDQNRATTLGGGIATRLNAVTNVYRSTVSNNTSNAVVPALGGDVGGGGISNVVGVLNIINSTISDNNSLAAGGGILNVAGVVNLTNDTITNNDSTLAGGGVVSTVGVIIPTLGVTNLRNTIIANNNDLLGTNILGRDVVGVLGSFNSLGNNLIGSNFGAEVEFEASLFVNAVPQPNIDLDIVGNVSIANQLIDPRLGALQNNGGQTDTRLPLTGSPAINRGNNCVVTNSCSTALPFALATEQRGAGYPRRQSSAVEIGAVEVVAPTAAGLNIAGRILQSSLNSKGLFRAVVSLTNPNGTVQRVTTNLSGAFIFEGVETGQTYILRVQHKQYEFAPMVITPQSDLLDINLVGIPSGGGLSSF